MKMKCSVIICTRNRAAMLEKTLQAFARVKVPAGWNAEIIIADNASTDDTAGRTGKFRLENFELRYLRESLPGKSRAQNSALALARGEALLFTDDDVEPGVNWLERMAGPLGRRECDGVAGCIQLSGELRRPWFTGLHKHWLAVVDPPAADSPELIGANMGLHRSVFDRIGNFDPEIGPGALGFGEETLLWRQMRKLGLRILPVADATVIHHPEPDRLQRAQWLASAKKHGAAAAYLQYHWEHENLEAAERTAQWLEFKLRLRRLIQKPVPMDAEGCAEWEMSYVAQIERCRQFLKESVRPRNYDRHGLRKKEFPTVPAAASEAMIEAVSSGR